MNQEGRVAKMKNSAQSTLEYVIIIAVAVAALIAMQAYLKRGMQGRMRESAENISSGTMYSPGASYSNQSITRSINETSQSYSEETAAGEKNISEGSSAMIQEINRTDKTSAFILEPRR